MLFGRFVLFILPSAFSWFDYSVPDTNITDFYVASDEIYIIKPKQITVTNTTLFPTHSFDTGMQNLSWFYYNDSSIMMCGVREAASNPCCFKWTRKTRAQVIAQTEAETCAEYTKRIRYFGYTDTLRDKFFVISQHSMNSSGSSRILLNDDLTIESRRKFHGQNKRLVIITPSFTFTNRFLIAIINPFKRHLLYIKATTANTDTDAQSNAALTCGKDIIGSGAFTLRPEKLNVDSSLINYNMIMHFVITNSCKICVFTEDPNGGGNADLRLDSQKNLAISEKKSLYDCGVSLGAMIPFEGMTINGGIAIFYARGTDVFKVVFGENDSTFRIIPKVIYTATDDITKIAFKDSYTGFVSTRTSVEMFTPHRCSNYTDCTECISTVRDPHCGWCTLEQRCSALHECMLPMVWTQDSCLEFSVDANNQDIHSGDTVLHLDTTGPALPGNETYTCSYRYEEEVKDTPGTVQGSRLSCNVPVLASVTQGSSSITVAIVHGSVVIGSVDVTYHRCDFYDMCQDCSDINKFCTWCPVEGKCSSNPNCVKSAVTDPGKCPNITEFQPKKMPRQIGKQIKIFIQNLPGKANVTLKDLYKCKVTSLLDPDSSQLFSITDQSTVDTIYCSNVVIDDKFPEFNNAESHVKIDLVYAANGVRIAGKQIPVYACELLTKDCVQCAEKFSSDPYECGYCTDKCAYTSSLHCESGTVITTKKKCIGTKTAITKVYPNWLPINGGANVTLYGNSLAIDNRVRVIFNFPDRTQTAECQNVVFENSTCLRCTGPDIMGEFKFTNPEPLSANITLKYNSPDYPEKYDSSAELLFTAMDIESIGPTFGPVSGGTEVTINGTYLCHPSETSVKIGNNACRDILCDYETQTLNCTTDTGSGENATVETRIGDGNVSRNIYSFFPDPTVENISPLFTLSYGGINITVTGSNLDVVQEAYLLIGGEDLECESYKMKITSNSHNSTHLVYTLPPTDDLVQEGNELRVAFKMDGVKDLCKKNSSKAIIILPRPDMISNNIKDGFCEIGKPCKINLRMTQIHNLVSQTLVYVGDLPCENTTINTIKTTDDITIGNLTCFAPPFEAIQQSSTPSVQTPSSSYDVDEELSNSRVKRLATETTKTNEFSVKVRIGQFEYEAGKLEFQGKGFNMLYVYIIGGAVVLLIIIIVMIVLKNKADQQNKMLDMKTKHNKELDHIEVAYTNAAKQAFLEMTIPKEKIKDIRINVEDIPYRIYSDYLIHIMFPNVDKKKMYNNFMSNQLEVDEYHLQEFKSILHDRHFLLTFIRVMEEQRDFQIPHRCEVASYLTCALYDVFEYYTEILFLLLDNNLRAEKTPKLYLRSTKCIGEKLLTNWLSLTLWDYIFTVSGPALYKLCYAIKLVVEQGPLDFVTHHAKCTLSQDRLLSENVEYRELHIDGEGPDGVKSRVSVLDCDTITQVKGKIYRGIYKHQPFSQQPNLDTLSLLWTPMNARSAGSTLELTDVDDSISEKPEEKKFNTLRTYGVQDGDCLKLTMYNEYNQPSVHTIRSQASANSKRQTVSEISRYHIVKNNDLEVEFKSPGPQRVPPTTKIAKEAFLNSLIKTKDQLTRVLDALINTIFMESNNIPPAIKYLFDYLDGRVSILPEKDRGDPEIAHVWKTNSLPLRFWINIIKNPQFLFDIEKTPILDSFLSVIGQCFMDSCSLSSMMLNTNVPANKLVYNVEVNQYRELVNKWYADVQQSPKVSLQSVVRESRLHQLPFKQSFAVLQLYKYAAKYQYSIMSALPTSPTNQTTVLRSDFEVIMKNSANLTTS